MWLMGFGIGFSQWGCVDFSLGFEKGARVDEEIFSVLIIHIETSYNWYCFLQLMSPRLEELKQEMEDKVWYLILVLAIDY